MNTYVPTSSCVFCHFFQALCAAFPLSFVLFGVRSPAGPLNTFLLQLSQLGDKLAIKLLTVAPLIAAPPRLHHLPARMCNYSSCRTNDAISWGNCTRRQMKAITGEWEWSAANLICGLGAKQIAQFSDNKAHFRCPAIKTKLCGKFTPP